MVNFLFFMNFILVRNLFKKSTYAKLETNLYNSFFVSSYNSNKSGYFYIDTPYIYITIVINIVIISSFQ